MLQDTVSKEIQECKEIIRGVLLSSVDLDIKLTQAKLALIRKTYPMSYAIALRVACIEIKEDNVAT